MLKPNRNPFDEAGDETVEYFLPTDFAGSTKEVLGLIDFLILADYEQYRTLAHGPEHKKNVAALEQSGPIRGDGYIPDSAFETKLIEKGNM